MDMDSKERITAISADIESLSAYMQREFRGLKIWIAGVWIVFAVVMTAIKYFS